MEQFYPFGYPDLEPDYKANKMEPERENPLGKEVGGNHYKSAYQPIELMEKARMFPCCANIVKYVFRHKNKDGRRDLEKALHYCDLLTSLGSQWYAGTATDMYGYDTSSEEFYKFIKANNQLDKQQIRAILAILHKDLGMLKDAINNEILEYYQ